MVGIEEGGWNGQWPTAQDCTGENAFMTSTSTLLVDEPYYPCAVLGYPPTINQMPTAQ